MLHVLGNLAEMEAEIKSTCRLLRFKILALHEHLKGDMWS